jgi:hypothetical protein
MKRLALAIALAVAASLVASPSSAYFRITTVACDTVGTIPLQVRTTFNVDLVGPGGYCWIFVDPLPVGPLPADSTHFYAAVAPAGWFAIPEFPGSQGFMLARQGQQCFGTGDHFEGFQLITNRSGPCAHFIFGQPLLDASDAVGDGCLVVDGPVPAQATSWGEVKAIYRR